MKGSAGCNQPSLETGFQTEFVLEEARKAHEQTQVALSRYLQKEVSELAREANAEFARLEAAESITRYFLGCLRGLSHEQKLCFQQSEQPLILSSPVILDRVQQLALERAVAELTGRVCPLHFAVNPALANSLELSSNGHRLNFLSV